MNPQDPLAALHPLREPTLVDWWPPAAGWWVLAGLAVLALAAGAFQLWRVHRRNAYRRTALRQLLALSQQFEEDGDTGKCLAAVNALLKSTALAAYPRRQIAPASGDQWLAMVNESLPPENQLGPGYLAALYGAREDCLQVEEVFESARIWIRKHKGLAV